MTKDLFSDQSHYYARYRPGYPPELFHHILQFVQERKHAWDCATGNGQAASVLADFFDRVDATDLSAQQLSHAVHKPNIFYHQCPAEKTPFPDNTFDLVTVATAYHWLDWQAFHREATRTGKNGCVVAVWSYNLHHCQDTEVDRIIRHFYHDITAPYWDYARKHVDEEYRNVAFDFDPLPARRFEFQVNWRRDELLGYLSSWSAVQSYIRANGFSPLDLIDEELRAAWNETDVLTFTFPLFLRIGRVRK
ncbi:MAG TPA: class I SAM-dependent methyltransferase [Flavisolibacter sp.]